MFRQLLSKLSSSRAWGIYFIDGQKGVGTGSGSGQRLSGGILMKATARVLAVDIGGTNVKILATGEAEPRKFASGKNLTPRKMVADVMKLAGVWKYDVVSIGYPGQVVGDRAVTEPRNLAHGWVGFDFAAAFGRPVKVINDAAMQALGSYEGGTMLFLGLGTGLGSALMVRGHIVPMER